MANASHALVTVFIRVLSVSWQAGLLVFLIIAVQWLLRERLSARLRHALWGLLLVRLVLPKTVAFPFSVHSLVRETLRIVSVQSAMSPLSKLGFLMQPASASQGAFVVSDHPLPFSWWQIAAVVWLTGVLCVIGAALLQGFRLKRLVSKELPYTDASVLALLDECRQRMRVSACIGILATSRLDGPALFGFLRPRLLLPKGLFEAPAADHLRYVILHELAHLKRRDILAGWLAYLLAALHWFNPALWWARRRYTADRELACDSHVLEALAPEERDAYGHAILDQYEISRSFVWSPALAGVLDGNTSIERRIAMISRFTVRSRKTTILAIAAMAVLAMTLLTDAQEKPVSRSAPSTFMIVLPESGTQPVAVPLTEQQEAPVEENVNDTQRKPLPEAAGNIGVYNRKLILKSWRKVGESYAGLQAEVAERQKGIDELSNAVQKEKDDYEKAKPGLSSKERDLREAKITRMYQDYKARLASEQVYVDKKEQAIMKDFLAGLDKAAAGVGEQLGCIAVQPIDVNYGKDRVALSPREEQTSCEAIDITSRILEVLNKE